MSNDWWTIQICSLGWQRILLTLTLVGQDQLQLKLLGASIKSNVKSRLVWTSSKDCLSLRFPFEWLRVIQFSISAFQVDRIKMWLMFLKKNRKLFGKVRSLKRIWPASASLLLLQKFLEVEQTQNFWAWAESSSSSESRDRTSLINDHHANFESSQKLRETYLLAKFNSFMKPK